MAKEIAKPAIKAKPIIFLEPTLLLTLKVIYARAWVNIFLIVFQQFWPALSLNTIKAYIF
jgi:hypothetical protein